MSQILLPTPVPTTTMSELAPRVWFSTSSAFIRLCLLIRLSVTGTSTGLGRAVTEIALEKGELVIATARRPSSLDDQPNVIPRNASSS